MPGWRTIISLFYDHSVADPGFPAGGGGGGGVRRAVGGGRQPLTWALFSKNVCENKRIGPVGGGGARTGGVPRSANATVKDGTNR